MKGCFIGCGWIRGMKERCVIGGRSWDGGLRGSFDLYRSGGLGQDLY
ncbi:MAG: hypothetical protein ACJA16_000125 [Akkermansiaceae bacterium]|jgi:hypothetical protein